MNTQDHACVFVRADGARLADVERLVVALPRLLEGALARCDLAFDAASRFLAVTARLAAEGATPGRRARLTFWSARAGGWCAPLATVPAGEAARLRGMVERCDLLHPGVAPEDLFDAAGRFFTAAGAPRDRRRDPAAEPVLAMDLGGPGREGIHYQPEGRLLFVAAPVAPPAGDLIALAIRLAGVPRPVEARAVVVEVRRPEEASPGTPAGYTLGLEAVPPALEQALRACRPQRPGGRAAPRFAGAGSPVRVVATPSRPAPPSGAPPADPADPSAGRLQDLSQGGAFVRTPHPLPVGSPLELELRLPSGAELTARADVAHVSGSGMGVRFALDPAAEAVLASAMAALSARPRRALLVDDDALVRRMLGDAFTARGFEVLTAADATDGLRTLAHELLALDLLVTDVRMPGVDGEELVRRIRQVGGEADLAIVVVSARLEGGLEARLAAAGADAVLDKAMGPEAVAEAADAALERKRRAASAP